MLRDQQIGKLKCPGLDLEKKCFREQKKRGRERKKERPGRPGCALLRKERTPDLGRDPSTVSFLWVAPLEMWTSMCVEAAGTPQG